MNKIEIFWEEFSKIKDALMDIDSLNDNDADKLLLDLDSMLKKASSGVDFILGDLTVDGRTLIFTANGDIDFFDDVIAIVENAPAINLWRFEGFLPPEGKKCSIKYEKYYFKSSDLYFIPLESEEIQDKIGLRIGVKKKENNDDFTMACYMLVEKMIGEYYATTLIDYFEVEVLPADIESSDYIPLDNLPDFVSWKIEKINNAE
ncbi:MAG: hypothetical protein KBT03_12320 [Bacteroidales bacterium]|nr:hypothetical protein [Candidatus Scybalousia scybalohippi]